MVYEKTLYQKINTVADWIIRIIMLNVMMIVSSLAIITIYPSLTAGYKMFYQYVHKDEEKLFKGYIQYFLEDIGKKIIVGLIIFVIIGLGYLNVTYYVDLLNAESNFLFTIGYYLTLAVLVSSFIITLYSLAVMHILPKLKLTLMFKLGFYLSGKFFFRTILLVLTVAVPFLMLMSTVTMVFFVFAGLSIPVLLNVLITNKVVDYVEGLVKQDV
ncbi:MAG: DUF624 domain-containing protein [Acholeplasmataceae bacterium]|nr:DUF624 domain-containing protein [Acholeplasmataceae bacterium]